MAQGSLINWSNASQTVIASWSCNANQDALIYGGTSKSYYYTYISGIRWHVWYQGSWNLFGTPTVDFWSYYWNGSSWVQYGSKQRCANNTIHFYDRGTQHHIYRIRYQFVSGVIPEDLRGGIKIGGYGIKSTTSSDFKMGTESNYNNNIRGQYLRLRDKTAKFYSMTKSNQNKDYKPTDSAVYSMYNTKNQKGSWIYDADNPYILFQEI